MVLENQPFHVVSKTLLVINAGLHPQRVLKVRGKVWIFYLPLTKCTKNEKRYGRGGHGIDSDRIDKPLSPRTMKPDTSCLEPFDWLTAGPVEWWRKPHSKKAKLKEVIWKSTNRSVIAAVVHSAWACTWQNVSSQLLHGNNWAQVAGVSVILFRKCV